MPRCHSHWGSSPRCRVPLHEGNGCRRRLAIVVIIITAVYNSIVSWDNRPPHARAAATRFCHRLGSKTQLSIPLILHLLAPPKGPILLEAGHPSR